MSIAQQVVLRHRDAGHLRFDLPTTLSGTEFLQPLVTQLGSLEGVYRVDLHSRGRKLSIRYLETVCRFKDVIRRLHDLVGEASRALSRNRHLVSQPHSRSAVPHSGGVTPTLSTWLKAKLEELRETASAMGILLNRSVSSLSTHRPKWLKEFMNDLVMLFLIKLHWHHIITEWLPKPWTYRYEWAATLYLVYLSVQARLPPQNA